MRDDVDAVMVCASTDLHHSIIKKAAIAGKHIFTEKVLCFNEADALDVAKAVKENRLGGIGIDVYSTEPFGNEHPFYEIKEMPNVLLTPHNAWGAYEARKRCLYDIIENIKSFYNGGKRSRVDIK